MNPLSTPQVMTRGTANLAPAAGDTDLVIVVLNELACAGRANGTILSRADYAGAIPPAVTT
jgi:hypothetical protein